MLYRRIFTQVPLQCVCNKIIYIKSGKFVNISLCMQIYQDGKVCQLAVFCVKLSSADLCTVVTMPPAEGIVSNPDMSLETSEKITNQGSPRMLFGFWFFLEYWSREYLPQNCQHKTGYQLLTLMFPLELSTNNYEEGNTFLIKFPTIKKHPCLNFFT